MSKRLLDRCEKFILRNLRESRGTGRVQQRYCKHVITFNEGPGRRKIWPGSKNFSNFNPSFVAGRGHCGGEGGGREEEEEGWKKNKKQKKGGRERKKEAATVVP